ncbi:MAG: hypothetical protein Q8S19_08280 [Bacillota bacterium]|nr:hypothetical protein [Bacillota bacterium]
MSLLLYCVLRQLSAIRFEFASLFHRHSIPEEMTLTEIRKTNSAGERIG